MFENFEWKGLDNIPISPYREYIYEVKVMEGADLSNIIEELNDSIQKTDYSLYKLQKQFNHFGGNGMNANKGTFIIKSVQAEDKTYLIFNFDFLEGQSKPDDMKLIANCIKSCTEIQSVDLIEENTVYKLSDSKYKDLIIKNSKDISREILFSDTNISREPKKADQQIKELAVNFALEHYLPREGTIVKKDNIDRYTVEWLTYTLQIEHRMGYLTIDKDFIDKLNQQTHARTVELSERFAEFLEQDDQDNTEHDV